jgi:hypothetical protein
MYIHVWVIDFDLPSLFLLDNWPLNISVAVSTARLNPTEVTVKMATFFNFEGVHCFDWYYCKELYLRLLRLAFPIVLSQRKRRVLFLPGGIDLFLQTTFLYFFYSFMKTAIFNQRLDPTSRLACEGAESSEVALCTYVQLTWHFLVSDFKPSCFSTSPFSVAFQKHFT